MPGSGKSTLCTAVVEAVPTAVDLDDAVHAAVASRGQDAVARGVARVTRDGESRLWRRSFARSTDRYSGLIRFLTESPEALASALDAQASRRDRDRAQGLSLGWLLGLMSDFQLATESLDRDSWLVVDEGFSQRALAVFGFGFGPEDESGLARYLAATPLPRTLIVVDTAVEECARRLDRRGWSERVADLGPADRLEFLTGCHGVVTTVAEQRKRAGSEVIWVDGTTPTPHAVVRITATFAP